MSPIEVGYDEMMDPNAIIGTGAREYDQGAADREYTGLHLRIGTVIAVDRTNFTVLLTENVGDKKYWIDTAPNDPYNVQAQLILPMVGMAVNSVPGGLEKFCAEVQYPPIGSQVVYGQLYGVEGKLQNTVVLGSIFPHYYQYNFSDMFAGITKWFGTLNVRKLIDSPTGYYWYETEDGKIVTGKVLIPPGLNDGLKMWEEIKDTTGDWTYIVYAGGVEMAKFGINPGGQFRMENVATSMKDILNDIQAILLNLVTPGNLIGNLGAPVVYTQVATDLPKATGLALNILALME